MEFSINGLSIEEAKKIDMVGYLSSLGHQAASINGTNYWYLSPFRKENKPSFKINVSLNRWYDFGLGKGGSIIDFCLLYFDRTIPEIIQNLSGSLALDRFQHFDTKKVGPDGQSKIKIVDEFELTSYALISYLKQRLIPVDTAARYCKEIRYQLYDKTWYGIGFKNDLGGYEIRNKYFKGSSSPKGITTIHNNAEQVAVFEGFFDFLSYLTICNEFELPKTDFIVLNSLVFFESTRSVLENYQSIDLYLDNDTAGQICRSRALSLSGQYRDKSSMYKDHDDLNDFLVYGSDAIKTKNFPQPRPP